MRRRCICPFVACPFAAGMALNGTLSAVYSSNLIFKGIQQTRVYVVCLVAANVEHLRENTRF